MTLIQRVFIWLIVRDICPCQLGMPRLCAWLDHQLLVLR